MSAKVSPARRAARNQLRYGYFDAGPGLTGHRFFVYCPTCLPRVQVLTATHAGATPTEACASLENALTDHIRSHVTCEGCGSPTRDDDHPSGLCRYCRNRERSET